MNGPLNFNHKSLRSAESILFGTLGDIAPLFFADLRGRAMDCIVLCESALRKNGIV